MNVMSFYLLEAKDSQNMDHESTHSDGMSKGFVKTKEDLNALSFDNPSEKKQKKFLKISLKPFLCQALRDNLKRRKPFKKHSFLDQKQSVDADSEISETKSDAH